jgi:hypothetical protein
LKEGWADRPGQSTLAGFTLATLAAIAMRNTLPEFLATAAKTSILVKFIRDRIDLSRSEGTSLAA